MQIGSDGSQHDDPSFSERVVIGGREVTVEFIHHAHRRMRERGVLVDEVIQCLRTPDERNLPAEGQGRRGFGRYDDTGNRMLKVVFEKVDDTRILVVSVMWVRRTAGGG